MDFKKQNDIDREYFKQDFKPMTELLFRIRQSLRTGKTLDINGINLKGIFFCCQQAALMMGDNGGAIVNISSGTSTQTTPGRAPYVISKGGVNAMTAVLAAEWADDSNGKKAIRVNAVAPGWILTNMVQDGYKLGVVSENQILAAVPFKRLADPSEIADAVVFLGSDESSYITGQTLFVDGGWSALGMPAMDMIKK